MQINGMDVLIIIPYHNIYPPMNGGMQRCFHILHQLAKHVKVTAIIHQDRESFEQAFRKYPALMQATILSTANLAPTADLFAVFPNRVAKALRYRWYKKKINATTDANFLLYFPVLRKVLKEKTFDFIFLENLDTLNVSSVIRSLAPRAKIIYDAHNVDSTLPTEAAAATCDYAMQDLIKRTESSLYKKVDAVIACSEHDLKQLVQMNAGKLSGAVVPNGVEIDTITALSKIETEPTIVFCGSLQYLPNAKGMTWFYNEVWPIIKQTVPAVQLRVVTQFVPPALQTMAKDKQVWITGVLTELKSLYATSSVAIAPLMSGSGTRLKILEAMGQGVPVVSTTKGAEGLTYTNGEHIYISDAAATFADAVLKLFLDKQFSAFISRSAFQLVKRNYDWNHIGTNLYKYLQSIH